MGINADDMFYRLNGIVDKRDLKPYSYPPMSELRKIQYRSVCLGSFVPWDVKKQVSILKKELGWKQTIQFKELVHLMVDHDINLEKKH